MLGSTSRSTKDQQAFTYAISKSVYFLRVEIPARGCPPLDKMVTLREAEQGNSREGG